MFKMKKFLNCLFLILVFTSLKISCDNFELLNKYPLIVEKLIYYKFDRFKVFYGGPVTHAGKGAKWMMPFVFEDYTNRTRAVYEAAFINCDLNDSSGAEILFVEVPDINIKLKNALSKDFSLFSSLIKGEYKEGKYIVVRLSDVANIYYPDIFIFSEYGRKVQSDKNEIVKFLHEKFKTQSNYIDYYMSDTSDSVYKENKNETIYKQKQVEIVIEGKSCIFYVEKIIKKNDPWKLYYVITKKPSLDKDNDIFLRIDSGCVSGQIYNDESCDCLDQLHEALKQLEMDNSNNGMIIHIPSHDGRGFGTAPKAETEIYKIGGDGRIHSTFALDTVTAAKSLFGTGKYDLRSYDGVAQILKDWNFNKVILLTDNVEKVSALQKYGIEVLRKKTDTNKFSCASHLDAKKRSDLYFSE